MSESSTATISSTVELRAEIAKREERRSSFTQQVTTFSEQITELENSAARAVADGLTPDASIEGRTQSFVTQRDALRRALNVLDADLGRLHFETKDAEKREAAIEAANAEQLALEAVKVLDTALRTFAARQLAPVALALDTAFDRARHTRNLNERLSGAFVTQLDADPIPRTASEQYGPALRLLASLRAFLQEVERDNQNSATNAPGSSTRATVASAF